MIVGAPTEQYGQARLYLGSPGGLHPVPAWTATDAAPPVGQQPDFATTVAGADLDGDGFSDSW